MRRILAIAVTCLAATVGNADELTPIRPISRVRFDGQATNMTVYFETPSGSWGPAGCPNARYVMVRDLAGLKELLAIGLAAKLAEKSVSFQGTCRDADYFSAYYVIVE